ncbi:MAG TPA: YceI family protein [Chitinophagaceae bacterium]
MLKKSITTLTLLLLASILVQAQDKFFTKSGKIEFFSNAPMEDIEAQNRTVTAVLDTKNGALQFSVLMKGFEFQKALMQEHFNENYVESHKYPKGEFKGTIVNNADINYSKPGTYPATVQGKLTIHGVTRDVLATGTVTVDGPNLLATSSFNIRLSDYNIKVPSVVKDKLSNNIKITVDTKLEPLKG